MRAVRESDLLVMKEFTCEREAPCDFVDIEAGKCCNSCWSRRFAEKALKGRSMRVRDQDDPARLGLTELLMAFAETVEQLGGKIKLDFVRRMVYLLPPKADFRTTITFLVLAHEDGLESQLWPTGGTNAESDAEDVQGDGGGAGRRDEPEGPAGSQPESGQGPEVGPGRQ